MYQHKITRKSTAVFTAVIVGIFVALSLGWTLMSDLTTGLFLGTLVTIPSAILGWFVLSLVLYIQAKKRGDDDLPDLKARMRVATSLLIFLLVLIVVLIVFFSMAISYM